MWKSRSRSRGGSGSGRRSRGRRSEQVVDIFQGQTAGLRVEKVDDGDKAGVEYGEDLVESEAKAIETGDEGWGTSGGGGGSV